MTTEATKTPEPTGADIVIDDQMEGCIHLLKHRGFDLHYVLNRMFEVSLENLVAFTPEQIQKEELHQAVEDWCGHELPSQDNVISIQQDRR